MNFEQRVSAMVAGLTPATEDTVQETHDRLFELLGVGGDYSTEPGVKLALADRFPEFPSFQRPDLSEMLRSFRVYIDQAFSDDRNVFPWLDYVLCRWAAAASSSDLRELARIAMNRDGTTASIEVGSELLEVLRAAAELAPELVNVLGSAGLQLDGAIRFGCYPYGSVEAAAVTSPVGLCSVRKKRPLARRGNARAVRAAAAAATAPGPVTVHPGGDVVTMGDLVGGPDDLAALEVATAAAVTGANVFRDGLFKLSVFGRLLSIREAFNLGSEILDQVKAILLPSEGFTWNDDQENTSLLIFNDGHNPELMAARVEMRDGRYHSAAYGFGAPADGAMLGAYEQIGDAKAAAADFIRRAQGE